MYMNHSFSAVAGCVHGVEFGDTGRLPPNTFARQLSVNVATVYRWTQRGARKSPPLRLLRVGGRTFITDDAWRSFHEAVNGVHADEALADGETARAR